MELESALEGRQKIMEETAARIEELEESQANLQTQVPKICIKSKRFKCKKLLHSL